MRVHILKEMTQYGREKGKCNRKIKEEVRKRLTEGNVLNYVFTGGEKYRQDVFAQYRKGVEGG
jgi:hypothetical protein